MKLLIICKNAISLSLLCILLGSCTVKTATLKYTDFSDNASSRDNIHVQDVKGPDVRVSSSSQEDVQNQTTDTDAVIFFDNLDEIYKCKQYNA